MSSHGEHYAGENRSDVPEHLPPCDQFLKLGMDDYVP
jgi:hypothetical protein